ncbi:hypothetical protein FK529_18250 [Tsukamurella asaccharolytica]|uniref:MinD-like ATPase involved in chromosome partitioning or flagellar assembly n=1 Tax=Tsukamurella asaccharolytica TaxID=2592067 RepID=A0A5C5R6G7_9ACTN|nr:hypothetical protein [Tsukamurella asaccharolytica]TWS17923.1 hypothetical protein FK529_18250 [Tsukamurella asaccharolytica]
MSDAATNVRVPFVPQNSSDETGSHAATLPSTDAAVPVVRPADPSGSPLPEPVSGEWEEPELPEVDDLDGSAVVPTVPTAEPAVVAADERPTAEQPVVVDDQALAPEEDAPETGLPSVDAPKPGAAEANAPTADVSTNGIPTTDVPTIDASNADAPTTDAPAAATPSGAQAVHPIPAPASVPQPQQPQQWQGGHNGFVPGAAQNTQAPFQGVPPTGQFQAPQVSGPIQRPAAPQVFGQAPGPVQGPAAPMVPQHQQAPVRPVGESLSAPMSTASSSFNQQIRFSDSAVRVSGWRAWMRRVGLDVGPSANDQEHAELVHRIRVPKHKFHVTSVFADNAGGTLLVGVLGQILERTRADNVVALDLDPDGGDLDQVTAWHQGGSTARTLIQQSDLSDRNQVDKHLAVTSTNLHVLPTPWRFNGRDVADYDDVLDLYSIFRPHYSLAVVDAGRGLQTPTGTGVLEISSALILPASATTRGVRRVAATIDWLRHHGWHGLLANTIVVINHTKRRGSVSVEQFDELFRAGQKLRVHEIPYDPHLDSDQPIDIDLLRKRTVRAFEELAADLADGFNSGYEPPAAQKLAELQQVRTTEGR